jgi:uncharacterized membrane-anchored protein
MNNLLKYVEADDLGGAIQGGCPRAGNINNITDFINFFTCTLMRAVVPLLVSLAVAGFVYGIIKYFLNPENEEKRKEGKTFMVWGLIALFVIVSIWGIVRIFSNSFGTGNPAIPFLPV